MATTLSVRTSNDVSNDPALDKVNREHGVEYANRRFGKTLRTSNSGLKIEATFCPENDQTPFDTVDWELRSAAIKDESGRPCSSKMIVKCRPVGVNWRPTWSYRSTFTATHNRADERERSVRQLIHRVTRTITDWGLADGYFDTPEDGDRFYRDLTWLCLHQHGAFNSPVWFNVGLHAQYGVTGTKCNWRWNPETNSTEQPENPYEFPQGSACFIQSVDDDMEDIMRLACSEAMLFKFGSGTGTDLSTIRIAARKAVGRWHAIGAPVVHASLRFDRRRGQKWRQDTAGGQDAVAKDLASRCLGVYRDANGRKKRKAHALIREGYESNFNGEAYGSVCFQNANLSVRVTR